VSEYPRSIDDFVALFKESTHFKDMEKDITHTPEKGFEVYSW
jgi:hypothetical protein